MHLVRDAFPQAEGEALTAAIVLGIGSPFARDDVGWQAIDLLEASGLCARHPGCTLAKLDRPGVSLLDAMRGYAQAILVDAMLTDDPPGTVRQLALDDLACLHSTSSTHELGVAETLALGERLDLLPPRLAVLGIRTGDSLPRGWGIRLAGELDEILSTTS